MRALSTGGAAAAALALTAGLGLAACSSSSSSSSSTSAAASTSPAAASSSSATASASAAAASSCGTIPTTLPSDPDGVIAALPAALQQLYNGYPVTVYKSAFASWKPKSASNKTIGFLLSETNNGYQLALQAILSGMLKSAGYTVDVPPNALRGIASDAAYLSAYLNAMTTGPVVLVGHSYGGAVITNAATGNPNVKALVYVDAFIPDQGDTLLGILGSTPGSALGGDPSTVFNFVPAGPPTPTTDVYVKPSVFPGAFANDLPAAKGAVHRPGHRSNYRAGRPRKVIAAGLLRGVVTPGRPGGAAARCRP